MKSRALMTIIVMLWSWSAAGLSNTDPHLGIPKPALVYAADGQIRYTAKTDIGWLEMRVGTGSDPNQMRRVHFGAAPRGSQYISGPGHGACTRTGPDKDHLSDWSCKEPPDSGIKEYDLP